MTPIDDTEREGTSPSHDWLQKIFSTHFNHLCRPKLLAPRIARQLGIELVFYGENEAEYGNPISDTESATRSDNYFLVGSESEFFLGGVPVSDLLDDFGIELVDLQPYLPLTRAPGSSSRSITLVTT